ncbi:MAG: signal peptidase II [Elusimicrobia bacterium]|nr:signal peptidase II [Elusimicrobiota bacterium]
MYKKSIIIIIAILLVDQLTKYFIVRNFYLGESLPVINNIFHITYITNTGTAFGLLQNYGNILLIFAIVAIIIITISIYKQKGIPKTGLMAFSVILGGAFGNLTDRLFRGSIVDFLDFRIWPVFNVADSSISIGIAILIIHSLFAKKSS